MKICYVNGNLHLDLRLGRLRLSLLGLDLGLDLGFDLGLDGGLALLLSGSATGPMC